MGTVVAAVTSKIYVTMIDYIHDLEEQDHIKRDQNRDLFQVPSLVKKVVGLFTRVKFYQ